MKKLIITFLFFAVCGFSQDVVESISFSDTTTSVLIDAPRNCYLAGIAKPDSGGDIITFEVELHADSTKQYVLKTLAVDSTYTITLPDSTNDYVIPLSREVFEPWKYIRVVFAKATTCDITVIWKRK